MLYGPIFVFAAKEFDKRHIWTPDEMDELRDLFAGFFKSGKCPSTADCKKAVTKSRKSHGVIHTQKNDNIKKKVWNMIHKD